RKLLHQLRHALPDVDRFLADDGTTLHWRPDAPYTLDVVDFEGAVVQAEQAEHAGDQGAVRAVLEQAMALYGGPLLPSCYDDWILPERERLQQQFITAVERLILVLEHAGDYRQAIQYGQRLLRYDPLHEATYQHLMRLHALSGDRTGALRVYRICATVLERELGVEPSAATREVYERAVQAEVAPRPPAVSLEPPAPRRHNLPAQLTSFIGRTHELAAVTRLLTTTRLLTLTGAGGCGKTRLALQVATQLLDAYPDGVWWVELATLADAALLPQAVAAMVEVREQPGQPLLETLSDSLHTKAMLLLLDNCEHLIEACAQLATELLRSCPQLRILATSREGLGIAGETTWRVPGLALPDRMPAPHGEELAQAEAVRLFVERAAAALPTFRITERSAPAVAQICQRLDGLPLAIELAAARVKLLSVEQIAARLSDCFQLLTSGSRTALPRHQTLRATIDWSYMLLLESERALLRRLAVFAGGWTLGTAEAICTDQDEDATMKHDLALALHASPRAALRLPSDVLEVLAHLVDKSLVVVEQGVGEARYHLLETVRQYADEKVLEVSEVAMLHGRHLDFFMTLAEQAESQMAGPDQTIWLDRLEAEHGNLRAALTWAINCGEVETALRLGVALWRFWDRRSHASEGRAWLEQALAQSGGVPALWRARALHTAGNLARNQGEYPRAAALYEEALVLWRQLGDRRGLTHSLHGVGNTAFDMGDYQRATPILEECLALFRELGDRHGVALELAALGELAWCQADYARSRRLSEEGLVLYRQLGERWGIGLTLSNLGLVAEDQGEYERAAALFEESMAHLRAIGDRRGIALTCNHQGHIELNQARYQRAVALCMEALAIFRELGEQWGAALALDNLGQAARSQGDASQAATLCEESLALFRASGDRRGVANALNSLGDVACDRGDLAHARVLYRESLALNQELGNQVGIAVSLEGLGSVAAVQGQLVQAVRLLTAAQAVRAHIGAPVPPSRRAGYDRSCAAVRTQLDETAFAAAWAAGRALPLEQAIALALGDQAESANARGVLED
ncbi:MAG TPA: tetratricopeptide repeat protein, partial [Roseiflexaceae bacterium]|nr:tetratricopeptide repeat protein [Roseiflexaceae bacterium]